eukprot:Rmarinus@m.9234
MFGFVPPLHHMVVPPPRRRPICVQSSNDRRKTLLKPNLTPLIESKSLRRGFLRNGMQYCILPHPTPPGVCEVHVEVHAGSLHEMDEEQGLAHFIEHVAFLGSRKRRDLMVLGVGAESNAYTDFNHTVYHFRVPFENRDTFALESAVDALREVVFGAKMLDSRIESERKAIMSELQMRNTLDYRSECRLLSFLHRENLVCRRFPIGLEPLIQQFGRETIRSFYERWYVPSNATVYAVGDFEGEEEEIIRILETFLGSPSLPSRSSPPQPVLNQDFSGNRGVEVFTHPLLSDVTTTIFEKRPLRQLRTVSDMKERILDNLTSMAVSLRAADTASAAADPPCQDVSFERTDLAAEACNVSTLSVTASATEKWEDGLRTAVRDALTLREFGVTRGEAEHLVHVASSDAEQSVQQISNTLSSDIVETLVQNTGASHVFLDAPTSASVIQDCLHDIHRDAINDAVRDRLAFVASIADPEHPGSSTGLPVPASRSSLGSTGVFITAPTQDSAEHPRPPPPSTPDNRHKGFRTNACALPPSSKLVMSSYRPASFSFPTASGSGKPLMRHSRAQPFKSFASSAVTSIPPLLQSCVKGTYVMRANSANGYVVPSPNSVSDVFLEAREKLEKPEETTVPTHVAVIPPIGEIISAQNPFPRMRRYPEQLSGISNKSIEGMDAASDAPTVLHRQLVASSIPVTCYRPPAPFGRCVVRVSAPTGGIPAGLAALVMEAVVESDLGTYSKSQVDKYCGKHLLSPWSGADAEVAFLEVSFGTGGAVDRMERALELVHAWLSELPLEEKAFKRVRNRYLRTHTTMRLDLDRATRDALLAVIGSAGDRFREASEAVLDSFTLEDARCWLASTFAGNKIHVSVVGDFNPTQLDEHLVRYLDSLRPPLESTPAPPQTNDSTTLDLQLGNRDEVVIGDDDSRSVVYMGFPLPGLEELNFSADGQTLGGRNGQWVSVAPLNGEHSPNSSSSGAPPTDDTVSTLLQWQDTCAALAVLNEIVNSRLFSAVRERKGLAYACAMEVFPFRTLSPPVAMITASPLPQQPVVENTIETILSTLSEVAIGRVSNLEVEKAKHTVRARNAAMESDPGLWLERLALVGQGNPKCNVAWRRASDPASPACGSSQTQPPGNSKLHEARDVEAHVECSLLAVDAALERVTLDKVLQVAACLPRSAGDVAVAVGRTVSSPL